MNEEMPAVRPRRAAARVLLLVSGIVAALTGVPAAARAGTANAGVRGASRTDPIAGLPWGVTRTGQLYDAYTGARGRKRQILGKLALEPSVAFLGSWESPATIAASTRQIIAATTAGDPNVLTGLSTFALNPWETGACGGAWNAAATKAWYRGLAAGIGQARTFVIAQIDLPFALCSASALPEQLTAAGVQTLAALRHTTVYLDAGAAEWEPAAAIAGLLIRSGIRHARGFSLNDTQYGSTALELTYGSQIVAALDAAGVTGKHFLVSTAQNGSPYLAGQVSGDSNDTPRCATPAETLCQRTGIPPTADVTSPRWGLGGSSARIAAGEVDAFVWAGQPWNVNGGGLDMTYALDLGANGLY